MKAFFLSRHFREKLVVTTIVVIAAVMWVSGLSSRTFAFGRDFKRTGSVLKAQKRLLDERPQIETAVEAAVKNLEPARTYDGLRLQTELDVIARATGVTNTASDEPRSEQTTQITMNTVQFTIRNASYEALKKFAVELGKRSPYIIIKEFQIVANRANAEQLNATLQVSSVEVAR